MQFDPNNSIIKLCAQGMELESLGKLTEAESVFRQAWNEATTDFEKFTAAHYVARCQKSTLEKLHWDEIALQFASKINDDTAKASFPSLYLNIAKCYEDLNALEKARSNYETAFSFANFLPDNGYGKMIKEGIEKGIQRTKR